MYGDENKVEIDEFTTWERLTFKNTSSYKVEIDELTAWERLTFKNTSS